MWPWVQAPCLVLVFAHLEAQPVRAAIRSWHLDKLIDAAQGRDEVWDEGFEPCLQLYGGGPVAANVLEQILYAVAEVASGRAWASITHASGCQSG